MKTTITCQIFREGPDSMYLEEAELTIDNDEGSLTISINGEDMVEVNYADLERAVLTHSNHSNQG